MKSYFAFCLTFFILMNNISYGQSYECDNNFEECGTPEQSGGGGAGGGSILIANTDLGDTYQNADDYDDDGIEDPQDNCPRNANPDQMDRDGDKVGDMCDNCLSIWNPEQNNVDADAWGDYCDSDIDNDQILNANDECPLHWGNSSCFNTYTSEKSDNQVNNDFPEYENMNQGNIFQEENTVMKDSCNAYNNNTSLFYLMSMFFIINLYRRAKES